MPSRTPPSVGSTSWCQSLASQSLYHSSFQARPAHVRARVGEVATTQAAVELAVRPFDAPGNGRLSAISVGEQFSDAQAIGDQF